MDGYDRHNLTQTQHLIYGCIHVQDLRTIAFVKIGPTLPPICTDQDASTSSDSLLLVEIVPQVGSLYLVVPKYRVISPYTSLLNRFGCVNAVYTTCISAHSLQWTMTKLALLNEYSHVR